MFVATDAASDQLKAADLATARLKKCVFRCEDSCHNALTVLKHALKNHEELLETDKLLVSGKKPYSLSKLMSTSSHYASVFQKEQAADAVQVLKHLGWAPQRFDSRPAL